MIDRAGIVIFGVLVITILIICAGILLPSLRQQPTLTLEQVQDACIRSAVINDDFEKVETCLKITGEKK